VILVLMRVEPLAQSVDPAPVGGHLIQSEHAPARNPFALAPSDPGALRYEDLATGPIPQVDLLLHPDDPIPLDVYRDITKESRASVDDIEAWAQVHNGPAVTAAWSAYTASKVTEAQQRRAEYEAGLTGIGDVGVP
jgi:hypothetical protein